MQHADMITDGWLWSDFFMLDNKELDSVYMDLHLTVPSVHSMHYRSKLATYKRAEQKSYY
jgi:hypothetical protein